MWPACCSHRMQRAGARAVGSIPLMPGGLLIVEAVLIPGLVTSGMSLPDAISAMLIYRLISWILVAVIGWVLFFFLFRTESRIDPDAAERGGIDAEPRDNGTAHPAARSDHRPDDP